ncbi:MAG: GNAT family N-acetyltransferase [Candidatus Omnitrophica bacterium]|nr:GNAT family N-acetyltransferase [Candidatus Omnitrophota bacterium]
MNIIYDQWLSEILKRKAYKIEVDNHFIENKGQQIVKDLQSKKVFLYSKVPVESVSLIEFLEKLRFHLIDTNIVLRKPVSSRHKFSGNALLRFACPDDENQVVELARRSFTFSRFHFDKNFPVDVANNIKAEWVRGYFTGKRGKYMVVALADKIVTGFLQLLKNDSGILTIDLIAVEKTYRKKGVASDIIAYAEQNCQKINQIKVGTQLANVPSMGLYERLGFRVTEAYYVFHYHSSKIG